MTTQELMQLPKEELIVKLREAREKFFHTREEVLGGKDKNHSQLRTLRKEIARIETCISRISHS
jgi:ribosomal protein L29